MGILSVNVRGATCEGRGAKGDVRGARHDIPVVGTHGNASRGCEVRYSPRLQPWAIHSGCRGAVTGFCCYWTGLDCARPPGAVFKGPCLGYAR